MVSIRRIIRKISIGLPDEALTGFSGVVLFVELEVLEDLAGGGSDIAPEDVNTESPAWADGRFADFSGFTGCLLSSGCLSLSTDSIPGDGGWSSL
jgi:hypothetical protein